MIKILFICHGNICRSAAAETVMRQMIREGRIGGITADSAAATREEIGNDIYPPMKRALQEKGYRCDPHAARQTVRADYDRYDYLIGMDTENLYDMRRRPGRKDIPAAQLGRAAGRGNRRSLVHTGFPGLAQADRGRLQGDPEDAGESIREERQKEKAEGGTVG